MKYARLVLVVLLWIPAAIADLVVRICEAGLRKLDAPAISSSGRVRPTSTSVVSEHVRYGQGVYIQVDGFADDGRLAPMLDQHLVAVFNDATTIHDQSKSQAAVLKQQREAVLAGIKDNVTGPLIIQTPQPYDPSQSAAQPAQATAPAPAPQLPQAPPAPAPAPAPAMVGTS